MHLSDEALSGLGTTFQFVFISLFGAISQIIYNTHQHPHPPRPVNPMHATRPPEVDTRADMMLHEANQAHLVFEDDDPHIATNPPRRKDIDIPSAAPLLTTSTITSPSSSMLIQDDVPHHRPRKPRLTDSIPNLGYFAAGGLSGITSRTATAPLDRLKVYLIAQTGGASEAVAAAKKGAALQATKKGMGTMWKAIREIWADGGIRSLFAGMFHQYIRRCLWLLY